MEVERDERGMMKNPRRLSAAIATMSAVIVCAVVMAFAIAPMGFKAQDGVDPSRIAEQLVLNADSGGATLDTAVDGSAIGAVARNGEQDANQDAYSETDEADDPNGYEEGAVLVSLEEGVSPENAREAIMRKAKLQDVSIESITDSVAKVRFGGNMSVEDAVKAITNSGAVAGAQPNYVYYAEADAQGAGQVAQDDQAATTAGGLSAAEGTELQTQARINDPKATTWVLNNLDVYDAWDQVDAAKKKSQVTVAVMDLGFNLSHEDFAGAFVYDAETGKYDKPLFVAPYNSFTNKAGADSIKTTDFHGNHVAGIIAAHVNNGKGVAGITNNMVQIMPIQAFNEKGNKTYTDRLVRGVEYVIKNAKKYNVRVLNMSLGGGSKSDNWSYQDMLLMDAIADAYDANIVPVSSAGNVDDSDPKKPEAKAPFYHTPGDLAQCVSVINLYNTRKDNPNMVARYDTSNYNTPDQMAKDISAPGTKIVSTAVKSNDAYKSATGTSMAAPVVSGVMALMFVANDKLTVDEAVSKLYSSSSTLYSKENKIGDPIWSAEFGYGAVNAKKAVSDGEYLTGAVTMFEGEQQTYELNLPSDVDASKATVSWSIYKSVGGKNLAQITANGLKATLTGKKEGSFVLCAEAKVGTRSFFAAQTVTVYEPLVRGFGKMTIGETLTYYTSLAPAGGKRTWTWKSSDPAVASVSKNGVVTAKGSGTTQITATLKSNPKITASKKVTVSLIDLREDERVDYVYKAPTYTGKPLKPKMTIVWNAGAPNETKLVEGRDYRIAYVKSINAGKNAGKVKITALPKSKLCKGSAVVTYNIKSASIANAKITGVTDLPYTGKTVAAQNPTVKLGNVKLKAGTDYNISYLNSKKKPVKASDIKARGTYYLVVAGKGNYTDTVQKSFKVVLPSVEYRTLLLGAGWTKWVKDGASAGAKNSQIGAIEVELSEASFGNVICKFASREMGWQQGPSKASTTGMLTDGIKAIKMQLTGKIAQAYNVYYRVKVGRSGWLGWAKNGSAAGVSDYSKYLESVQAKLVRKWSKAPGNTKNAYR